MALLRFTKKNTCHPISHIIQSIPGYTKQLTTTSKKRKKKQEKGNKKNRKKKHYDYYKMSIPDRHNPSLPSPYP